MKWCRLGCHFSGFVLLNYNFGHRYRVSLTYGHYPQSCGCGQNRKRLCYSGSCFLDTLCQNFWGCICRSFKFEKQPYMLTLYFKQKVCHVSSSKGKWKCHPWIPLGRVQDTNVDSLLFSSSYLRCNLWSSKWLKSVDSGNGQPISTQGTCKHP